MPRARASSVAELAAKTAESWKNGLAEWDQAPERIGRLRAAADVAIYTPGAETGLPLSVLRSFSPPSPELLADAGRAARPRRLRGRRDCSACWASKPIPSARANTSCSPTSSRARGARGLSLDMTGLIQAVQKPAFDKLGAFDLETFFPGERPPQARDAAEQPHRLARLRHVDAGRAARRAAPAVHAPRASRASPSSRSRI